MTGPRYTPLALSLPATVPFVGPETQERARGVPFTARLGANEPVELRSSMDELIEGFDLSQFGSAPTKFDVADLGPMTAKAVAAGGDWSYLADHTQEVSAAPKGAKAKWAAMKSA